MTAFRESQNRHKWSQCDGFCNIKAGRHRNSQKELAKTRLLKLSKTSRNVTAFSRHNVTNGYNCDRHNTVLGQRCFSCFSTWQRYVG
jgi:hypothetical protein